MTDHTTPEQMAALMDAMDYDDTRASAAMLRTLSAQHAAAVEIAAQYAAERDTLRAELEGLKAQGQWLPIETAPKDGTMFLCWVRAAKLGEDDDGRQFESDASEVDFCAWRVCVECPEGGYYDNMAGQIAALQHVTHWRPLPAPPTGDESAAIDSARAGREG